MNKKAKLLHWADKLVGKTPNRLHRKVGHNDHLYLQINITGMRQIPFRAPIPDTIAISLRTLPREWEPWPVKPPPRGELAPPEFLRVRMRTIRMLGVEPRLAAELVLEHFYREG
jgi:hypothetical protein